MQPTRYALPLVLTLALLAILATALLIAAEATAADDDNKRAFLPVDCADLFCIVPRQALDALLDTHNATVRENRRLRAAADGKPAPCELPRGKGA